MDLNASSLQKATSSMTCDVRDRTLATHSSKAADLGTHEVVSPRLRQEHMVAMESGSRFRPRPFRAAGPPSTSQTAGRDLRLGHPLSQQLREQVDWCTRHSTDAGPDQEVAPGDAVVGVVELALHRVQESLSRNRATMSCQCRAGRRSPSTPTTTRRRKTPESTTARY